MRNELDCIVCIVVRVPILQSMTEGDVLTSHNSPSHLPPTLSRLRTFEIDIFTLRGHPYTPLNRLKETTSLALNTSVISQHFWLVNQQWKAVCIENGKLWCNLIDRQSATSISQSCKTYLSYLDSAKKEMIEGRPCALAIFCSIELKTVLRRSREAWSTQWLICPIYTLALSQFPQFPWRCGFTLLKVGVIFTKSQIWKHVICCRRRLQRLICTFHGSVVACNTYQFQS